MIANYVKAALICVCALGMLNNSVAQTSSAPVKNIVLVQSHEGLPKALVVTAGFDMLRDVAHDYAQRLAAAGNDITYVRYPDLTHAFIQMTAHSKRCLESTQEVARLLGESLKK